MFPNLQCRRWITTVRLAALFWAAMLLATDTLVRACGSLAARERSAVESQAIGRDRSTTAQTEANRLQQQGLDQFHTGQSHEALQTFQRVLALRQALEDPVGEGETLNHIGFAYRRLGQYDQALAWHQRALKIARAMHYRTIEGESLHHIGAVYANRGAYTRALKFYEQALTIRREVGDPVDEGRTLNNMGNVYADQGHYPQALAVYQQALALRRKAGDEAGVGRLLNNIGRLQNQLGDYRAALRSHQQALTRLRDLGDRPSMGRTLNSLGVVYERLGQSDSALTAYQQALTIAKSIGDRRTQGDILDNLGGAHDRHGDYAQALTAYQRALTIHQDIGNRASAGNTLNNIGGVYERLGRDRQALYFLQRALAIHREIGHRAGEGQALNSTGIVYERLEQFPQALASYRQALAIARDIGDRAGEANALEQIGGLYTTRELYSKALTSYRQALAIAQDIGDRAGVGRTLNSIGVTYIRSGQLDRALPFLQRALTLLWQVGDRGAESITLSNIGVLLEHQKQPELAIVFYKQSVDIREAIRRNLRSLSPVNQASYANTVAETYRHLAALLLGQGRVLEAQQVLELLKVQELDDYLRDVRGTGQQLAILHPEQQILAQYNALQQSAIHLGQELTQLREISVANRTQEQQQRIALLVQLQEDLNRQFNDFLDSPEVLDSVDQLSRTAQRQNVDLADFDALRDDLRQLGNAVLLYPLILEDRLELIITTPDSPPLRRTVNVQQAELNRAILQFRQALQNPNADARPPARQLYTWLIQPLETDLDQADAQTIIYAPDGQLRYIPLAALYDGHQWLVQRYRINNITAKSLTELDTQPQAQPRVLAGAFADRGVTYPVTLGQERVAFRGLPFAGREVKNLATTLPQTTTLLDQNFSLAALKPQLNEHSIVHLATHAAFVPGQPEDSFILLGNGDRPTLRDIGNWSLQNVDLVVLSACETGIGGQLGSGEEILGLGYQFQNRGARAVIASLWQVSDGGTQALMDAFYATLQKGNSSKAEALQQAQVALIRGADQVLGYERGLVGLRPRVRDSASPEVTHPLSHPYYWAPFILIGNGL